MTEPTQSIIILLLIGLVAFGAGPLITYLTLTRRYEGVLHRTKVFHKNQVAAVTDNLQRQLDAARRETEHTRSNAAQVLEVMHAEQEQELAAVRAQHAKELIAAKATGFTASQLEYDLIDAMADKLSLASATFHAQQQFSDARLANQLSIRGHSLALRLRSQHTAPHIEGVAA